MAKKRKTDLKDPNGIFIYHDDKKVIYAPPFSSKGYVLNEENVRYYISHLQSFMIALLIILVAYIFTRNFPISLLLAVLFILSESFFFYRNFLSKAVFIENYKRPEKDGFIKRQAESTSEKQLKTTIIASPLLSIAIMLNSYLNGYKGAMFYLMAFIALISLAYGLLNIYILKYKKDH